jgi:hypothetical protein
MLGAVPPDCREMDVPIELDTNEGIKTLGLLWHALSDQFLISNGTRVQRLQEPKTLLLANILFLLLLLPYLTHLV